MTLFGMTYLANEEFSPPEKDLLGISLWPYWHYGVLLLYGQTVGLNHLMGLKQMNVVKLGDLMDYPTGNIESVFSKLHLHVYQVNLI